MLSFADKGNVVNCLGLSFLDSFYLSLDVYN